MTGEDKIDIVKMLPVITNIMSKVDFSKLQNVKVDKITMVYKIKDNKLMVNIKHEPDNKGFNDNFMEILKLCLGSDPKVKLEVNKIETWTTGKNIDHEIK